MRITTRSGIEGDVRVLGDGPPLVYLHGAGGFLAEEPMLDRLAGRHTVYAPVWPGYGEDDSESHLEDMGDFTNHGWDVVYALGLETPIHLVGHSMGGMIAAEMAAACPNEVAELTLISAAGLWIDEHPVTDIFAMLPFELAEVLFADPAHGEKLLTAGMDFSDNQALTDFMVGNARRLGTAGKILFPIPNRRLAKRLYRITAPTHVIWGTEDKLIPPVYADRFAELIETCTVTMIDGAGHMVPHEQPDAAAAAVAD